MRREPDPKPLPDVKEFLAWVGGRPNVAPTPSKAKPKPAPVPVPFVEVGTGPCDPPEEEYVAVPLNEPAPRPAAQVVAEPVVPPAVEVEAEPPPAAPVAEVPPAADAPVISPVVPTEPVVPLARVTYKQDPPVKVSFPYGPTTEPPAEPKPAPKPPVPKTRHYVQRHGGRGPDPHAIPRGPLKYVRVLASFADAVWMFRVRTKVSQRTFAATAGVNLQVLIRMESGAERTMRERDALAIAAAAGITDLPTYFREVP